MVYVIKWTENGKKRQLVVEYEPLALVLYNRIVIDCKHYDATLTHRKGSKN